MLEYILEQQQPLCATLIEICRSDLMPTDTNTEVFIEAMRPIAEITEVMGKEKSVLFSAALLFLHKLLHIHLIEQPTNSNVMKGIKQTVKSNLEDCYSDPQLMLLLNKACFLDPCIKSLSFLSEEGVILSVKEEAASGMAPCSETDACSDGPRSSKKSKFLELLDDVMDQPT